MENIRTSIFEENERLRKKLEYEIKKRRELQDRCRRLERRVKELESKLNQFLNANTPSSAIPPFIKPSFNERPENGTKPRGKPEGSNGATKETPKRVDRTIEVKLKDSVIKKYNGQLKIKKIKKRIYEIYFYDEIIEFIIEVGYLHGKLVEMPAHPQLPKQGMIGNNLQSFIIELKHNFAGGYEKISDFLENFIGESFSAQALKDSVERTADRLYPSYKKLELKLEKEKSVNSDETTWFVDGNKFWLWVLCSISIIFFTIKNSRGRRVITDILGENFQGVIGSDCLNVYREFAIAFQRCWSHLLRNSYFEAEKNSKKDITKLHEQLVNLFNAAVGFLKKNPTFEQRVWECILYQQKLENIINQKWKSKPAKKIVKMIKKHKSEWFVAVIMQEVGLTNNKAERAIRKVIPTRKLLKHRTEIGARNFAIIETHRQTWRLRNQSPYKMLVRHLEKCNMAL